MSIIVDSATDRFERTTALPLISECTMAGWFYRTATRSVYCNPIEIFTSNPSNKSWYIQIRPNAEGTWRLGYFSSGYSGFTSFSSLPAINTWFYLAMVTNYNNLPGYAYWWNSNGVLQSAVSYTATETVTHTATTAVWGCNKAEAANDYHILGKISNGRLWNRRLSYQELVSQMFQPTIIRESDINSAFGNTSTLDISSYKRDWVNTDLTYDHSSPPLLPAKKYHYFLVPEYEPYVEPVDSTPILSDSKFIPLIL